MVFVTGHECRGKSPETAVDWAALARTRATLCIYMGSRRLGAIASELVAGGMSGDTPLAVVTEATLPTQAVHLSTLDSAGELAATLVGKPALIIVGAVVNLAEILSQASVRWEAQPA